MADRFSRFIAALRDLETASSLECAFDSSFDSIVAAMQPHTLRAEYVRPSGAHGHIIVAARCERMAELPPREGFEHTIGENHTRLSRDGETLLVADEGGPIFEWYYYAIDPLSAEDAHRIVCSLPALEPFEAFARPPAFVKCFGIERTRDGGVRGLLGVHIDSERRDHDEQVMRDRGFRETDDEGLWIAGQHNLVWMGGTIYGYFGSFSDDNIGGW